MINALIIVWAFSGLAFKSLATTAHSFFGKDAMVIGEKKFIVLRMHFETS
jgi:hypothetical protein